MTAAESPRIVIRPRHEILGVEAGMPGYRRGCKCTPCRAANSKRMRDWRKKRDVDAHPERYAEVPPLVPSDPPQIVRIDQLPPGLVTTALAEELPKADGAYPFQRTVQAMLTKSALILDNADVLDRLDLVNPMQIRLYAGLAVLNPGNGAQHDGAFDDEMSGLGVPE